MPVYEYQCTECGIVEEALQKISDLPLETCSHCQGHLKKLISQSSFHLKGSGWYVTDYGGSKTGSDKKTETSPAVKNQAKPKESKTTSKKTTDSKD